ncbi:MAG: response regulator transcription factor [Candidatus Elarobacter sp.]
MEPWALPSKPPLDLIGDVSPDDRLIATLALDFDVRLAPKDGKAAHAVVIVASRADYRDALSRLRRRSNAPTVLVLLDGDFMERVDGLEHGADDVLITPYEASELLARVRAAIRRVDRTRSDVPHMRDLEIDPETRTVRRGARTVSLSRTELALLTTLARRRGAVVPHDLLTVEVWGTPKDKPLVHTFISYLRAKVDGPGELPLLQTVRGVGYALRPE